MPTMVKCICMQCGVEFERALGDVNIQKKNGHKLYCSIKCFHLSKQTGECKKTSRKNAQNRYRKRNRELLRIKNAKYKNKPGVKERCAKNGKQYYKNNYDKLRNAWLTPEYKKKKREYQKAYNANPENREKNRINAAIYYSKPENKEKARIYNAKKTYGEFWECALLERDIKKALAEKNS